jgi:hypothetical protein
MLKMYQETNGNLLEHNEKVMKFDPVMEGQTWRLINNKHRRYFLRPRLQNLFFRIRLEANCAQGSEDDVL